MKYPPEPTSAACTSNAPVTWNDGDRECHGYAIWYPQMGGYGSFAVLEPEGEGDACFSVYIWHDGEFPFSAHREENPAVLHHCSAAQFVRFGEQASTLMLKPRRRG